MSITTKIHDMFRRAKNFFINHAIYHIWYKHTKKHKQELAETAERVIEVRQRTIGR